MKDEKVVMFQIQPRADVDEAAYGAAFEEMVALVSQIPGFLSITGYTGEGGSEMAFARFAHDEAIVQWREQEKHVETRNRGREEFFEAYHITIATVTREYSWRRGEAPPIFD